MNLWTTLGFTQSHKRLDIKPQSWWRSWTSSRSQLATSAAQAARRWRVPSSIGTVNACRDIFRPAARCAAAATRQNVCNIRASSGGAGPRPISIFEMTLGGCPSASVTALMTTARDRPAGSPPMLPGQCCWVPLVRTSAAALPIPMFRRSAATCTPTWRCWLVSFAHLLSTVRRHVLLPTSHWLEGNIASVTNSRNSWWHVCQMIVR